MASEAAGLGVWEWDINSNALYWDTKMFQVFGVKQKDFLGHFDQWLGYTVEEEKDKWLNEFKLAASGKKKLNFEFYIIKNNAQKAKISVQAKLIKNHKGTPVKLIGVCTDITTKSILADQLKKCTKTNEEQNKYLSNFAHTMTHNLKSSSSNLTMLTGILKNEVDPAKTKMYLEMMEQACQRLDNTIKGLNETIEIRFGEDKKFTAVHIKKAINKAIENINEVYRTSKATLKSTITDALTINGIETYFESIFQNFITNSIKYAQPGIPPLIEISAKETNDTIEITYADNGKGIDLKQHGTTVFGMYKTFHGNKDAKGIGLYLTKNQIETMGGTISIESEPNVGTTFTLIF